MSDPAAVEALAAGFAKGLGVALRLEHPDLAWQINVGPVDRAKLARLNARDEGVGLTDNAKRAES